MSQPRLTGGRARGRVLAKPVPDGVRPTSSRVREALFSLVGHDLDGVRFLDAFGGSGLLGLEAWSRGASVVAVERDPVVAAALRANVTALAASVEVRTGDVLRLAADLGRFDVVVADPPYASPPKPIVDALAPLVGDALVLETDAEVEAPAAPAGLVLDRRRVYGKSALTVYRRER